MMSRGRFELKYLIRFPDFRVIRERMSAVCRTDSHAVEGHSYLIRSIYYDTANLNFFQEKIDGVGRRKKVRIRFYGNEKIEASFLEIKRRDGNMVSKAETTAPGGQRHCLAENPQP